MRWWSAPRGRLQPPDGEGATTPARRRRAVAVIAALAFAALVLVGVGVGVISTGALLAWALVYGVPVVLAVLTFMVVARRSHRDPDEQAQG